MVTTEEEFAHIPHRVSDTRIDNILTQQRFKSIINRATTLRPRNGKDAHYLHPVFLEKIMQKTWTHQHLSQDDQFAAC